jgi:hypothetical protein
VESMGRMLVIAGLALAAVGGLLWLGTAKGRGGVLPGDVFLERGNFKFFFPVVTCIVLSILLTLLARLFRR